ncbi:kinase/pyrophosphorylase, partial [Acinetobacter baumannii]|nr:kinase/pyrophosphorylase [Acinetobacter baumannii]
MNKKIHMYILSDSAGETASKLAQATMAQYDQSDLEIQLIKRTFIYEEKDLLEALNEAKELEAIVLQTLISKELVKLSNKFCKENNL